MANRQVFNRIAEAKKKTGKTWDEIAREAEIPVSSWMTGVPFASPSEDEVRRIAPVLGTTYEWLMYGRKEK